MKAIRLSSEEKCLEITFPCDKKRYYTSSFNKASNIVGLSYQRIIDIVYNHKGWLIVNDLPVHIVIKEISDDILQYIDNYELKI